MGPWGAQVWAHGGPTGGPIMGRGGGEGEEGNHGPNVHGPIMIPLGEGALYGPSTNQCISHTENTSLYIYIYTDTRLFFSNTTVAEQYRSHAHEDRSVERGETAGRFQHFVERLIEPCGVQTYIALIADVPKQVKHYMMLRGETAATHESHVVRVDVEAFLGDCYNYDLK
jgi:hypothetical protein